uniref:SAM domain-containing protein n=1 Tax=Steinernema glaseri TaxID=37863 RepID=A0A1I7YPX0_9BILA
MDRVPLIFIKSVVRNSKIETSQGLEQLSSAWRGVGEVQTKKSGRLLLTFAPYEGGWNIPYDDWRLHYKMEGFGHIESRTLYREVMKEMAKSITSIELNMDYKAIDYRRGIRRWDSIDPDDADLLQLLTNLDAPIKELDISSLDDYIGAPLYLELRSKYSNFFRSFTSVILNCIADTRVIEDTISEARLRSVEIWDTGAVPQPNGFWINYFFSEECTSFSAKFMDSRVVLGAIDRWKSIDPRTLKYSKVFSGIQCSLEDLKGVGIRKMGMVSKASLIEKVKREFERNRRRRSLYCIDHPVDPSSKIYVVLFKLLKKHYEVVFIFY